jgi:hypothetical protein
MKPAGMGNGEVCSWTLRGDARAFYWRGKGEVWSWTHRGDARAFYWRVGAPTRARGAPARARSAGAGRGARTTLGCDGGAGADFGYLPLALETARVLALAASHPAQAARGMLLS